VTRGVFARSAAKHCAEVVDEMGPVLPTQPNGEVGVIDAGMALDLQRGLLQPIATQHPLDRNAHEAPEYALRGPGARRRMLRRGCSAEERDRRMAEWAKENV